MTHDHGFESPPSSPFGPAPWRMEFRGAGSDFFVLTLGNAILNFLTIGIWFAWGRIRELRYLVGNVVVDGDALSFHGRGGELFKGVLIAFFLFILPIYAVFFVAAFASGFLGAAIVLVGYLGFALLVAFASVGSLRYRLPRTEWRGIRFGFDGAATDFLLPFLGRALLVAVTLGLYYPVYACWRRRWMLERCRFGTARFDCHAEPEGLYPAFIAGWLLGFVTLGLAWVWYQGHQQAYLWDRSTLGGARFATALTGKDWLLFHIANFFLVLFTFGLAGPWVVVRTHRFFLERLTLEPTLDLASIRQYLQATSGVGEGALDALDLDSGLDLG
jgi:uncharacterized membrane protein YjgN (DUF898 family)